MSLQLVPREIINIIADFLDVPSLKSFSISCKRHRQIMYERMHRMKYITFIRNHAKKNLLRTHLRQKWRLVCPLDVRKPKSCRLSSSEILKNENCPDVIESIIIMTNEKIE